MDMVQSLTAEIDTFTSSLRIYQRSSLLITATVAIENSYVSPLMSL